MNAAVARVVLFGSNVLQLLGRIKKVVGVDLGSDLTRVGLLDKVFVTLFFREMNGVLLGLEVDVCALHKVSR